MVQLERGGQLVRLSVVTSCGKSRGRPTEGVKREGRGPGATPKASSFHRPVLRDAELRGRMPWGHLPHLPNQLPTGKGWAPVPFFKCDDFGCIAASLSVSIHALEVWPLGSDVSGVASVL